MKKTVQPSHLLLATVTFAVFGLTACEKESEMDTIKDAQMCLNSAAPSGAQACVSKLASNNSPQANQLKCAAYFIQENLGTPTALIEALDQSNPSCSGCSSGSMAVISALSFPSGTAVSDAAFEVCSSSGVPVYTQISSLVQIATLAKSINASATTPDQYATAVNSIPASVLGELVQTTYASSCNSSNTSSNQGSALTEFCGELGSALSSATTTDVGECLKYKMGARATNPGNGCPNN
ncbi:MAG: hypothetical protein NDI63_13335 [Pseudobdellovibrio sp.]|nr:hypothetical protein [Pseudobdellovibrio sp.]